MLVVLICFVYACEGQGGTVKSSKSLKRVPPPFAFFLALQNGSSSPHPSPSIPPPSVSSLLQFPPPAKSQFPTVPQ
jgi:hypothetical protein